MAAWLFWKNNKGGASISEQARQAVHFNGTYTRIDTMEKPMNQFDEGPECSMGNTFAEASDEALVISAKAGMNLAYDELCRRHSASTLRAIRRITRSKEDAEDAMQECLLKAYLHLKAFDGRSAFSTWLTRIAINSALMLLRKKRTRPESSLDDDIRPPLQLSDPALDPEILFLKQERHFALRRAVRRLPRLLREAAEICYFEEASLSEVAERAHTSLAATKSRLHRAKKSLFRALGKDAVLHRGGVWTPANHMDKLDRTKCNRRSPRPSLLRAPFYKY
jgi:RNA polymerase sigma-70 factor (ECF subfamily)